MTTKKPHKFAEVIKAWADGAVIQGWTKDYKWVDMTNPTWDSDTTYRVKPEIKPDLVKYVGLYQVSGYSISYNKIGGVYSRSPNFTEKFDGYDLVNKLELVFDGESGKLKKVNILENKQNE